MDSKTRIILHPLAVSFLVIAGIGSVRADPGRGGTRELSNTSVMGLEELESPTHRNGFEMIQFVPDPIRRFNEISLKITKPAVDWILVPVAKGFRFVFPARLRTSFDNFSYNLTYPDRFVSLLLQGELRKSIEETGHFLTNTTFGLAGFFDPAEGLGIETHSEDVGQAFARWGIPPGFYVFLPFLGPSTARDSVGRVFDLALNPLTWAPVPGLNAFFGVNAFSFRVDGYETFVESQPQLYVPVRALWTVQRRVEIENYEIPEEAYESSDPEPSLGVLLLDLKDPRFPRRSSEVSIEMPTTGRKLWYSAWLQEEPAPLLFLIPGIGAHRLSTIPVALAEMAYRRGYSVAVLSSPFHPEFIVNALSDAYPGYTPSDAEDLYTALSLMHDELRGRLDDRITSVKLMGYSLGALETLFIAAAQPNRNPGQLRFDRFLALNPPVGLPYAGLRFDDYFDAPLDWLAATRDRRVLELAMKTFLIIRDGVPPGKDLPLSRTESEFLVGLSGRVTLMDALAAARWRGAVVAEIEPVVDEERGPLIEDINRSSFANYAFEAAVPHFMERYGLGRDDVVEQMSLDPLAENLREDESIRVLTNANDFILGKDGLKWLRVQLGDRLTVFPRGGHLGNLHVEEVQDAVFGSL